MVNCLNDRADHPLNIPRISKGRNMGFASGTTVSYCDLSFGFEHISPFKSVSPKRWQGEGRGWGRIENAAGEEGRIE